MAVKTVQLYTRTTMRPIRSGRYLQRGSPVALVNHDVGFDVEETHYTRADVRIANAALWLAVGAVLATMVIS